jgi:hypothetical protein
MFPSNRLLLSSYQDISCLLPRRFLTKMWIRHETYQTSSHRSILLFSTASNSKMATMRSFKSVLVIKLVKININFVGIVCNLMLYRGTELSPFSYSKKQRSCRENCLLNWLSLRWQYSVRVTNAHFCVAAVSKRTSNAVYFVFIQGVS